MLTSLSRILVLVTAVCLIAIVASDARAQSGTRSGSGSRSPGYRPAPTYRPPPTYRSVPSQSRSEQPQSFEVRERRASATLGLEGYSPVAIATQRRWLLGSPRIQSTYDGRSYRFVSVDERRQFDQSPERFVPALGGDCTVCFVTAGARVPGSVRHAATSEGRIYLFPSEAEKEKFIENPAAYVRSDIAFDGNCVVCFVNGGERVSGRAEFTAIFNGLRYQFPSAIERAEFLKRPAEFVSRLQRAESIPTLPAPGSQSR